MATPVITPLPPAPTRADGASDFSTKADAMSAALPPMVIQQNAAFVWQAGIWAQTQVARDDAADSATAAADSAAAAAGQVALAAAQVALAVTARQGSEAARDQSQVYASAAQSAAGVPALTGNRGKVLSVNQDESGVGWTVALPDIAGNAGKTLKVNLGATAAQWVNTGMIHVAEEMASGNNPATPSTGLFFTRALNTVKSNTLAGSSLASSQITLPAGTYRARGWGPAGNIGRNKLRLFNVTSGSAIGYGESSRVSVDGIATVSPSVVSEFVLSVTSVIRLEHRLENNPAQDALGSASNFAGIPEIYAQLTIERVA